jgi:hypothetical protein
MSKALRAIIGQKQEPKSTKVTLVRSPNAEIVKDAEGKWIDAATKAPTIVNNPEGDDGNYKTSLKKDNTMRPDGGTKVKLGEDEQIDELTGKGKLPGMKKALEKDWNAKAKTRDALSDDEQKEYGNRHVGPAGSKVMRARALSSAGKALEKRNFGQAKKHLETSQKERRYQKDTYPKDKK